MSEVLRFCGDLWKTDSDGRVVIGTLDVETAVRLAGGTPAYLYDRAIIGARVAEIREAFKGIELLYSVKANPFQPLLDYLAPLVDGFDVASSRELLKAVCAGRSGSELQLSGPGKDSDDLEQAVSAGALINIESSEQIIAVAAAGAAVGKDVEVVLRVNPHSLSLGGGLRMGGAASQFGMDLERIPEVVALCRRHEIIPIGFHFYWGTQCLDGSQIAAAQRECWRTARMVAEENGLEVTYVNLGGGFGIPYYRGDTPLDLGPVEDSLGEIRMELLSRRADARLVIELGRYLVGPAGIYVTRILDVKTSGETKIAVADGGMHQHLAASGNLGQAFIRSMPCFTPSRMSEPAQEDVRVVGRLCTPIDILCAEARLPPVSVGDLVAIFQSGAYGATASPGDFLGHPPVRELLL